MKLDKEEKELLKSLENREWRSIDNLDKEIEKARTIARATGTKDERMNIQRQHAKMSNRLSCRW